MLGVLTRRLGELTLPRAATSSPSRFWTVYGIAWTAYGAGLAAILIASGRPPGRAVFVGLSFVVTAALAGIGVIALCERVPWPPQNRTRFVVIQLASGAAFTVASVVGTLGLLSIGTSLLSGVPALMIFPGPMLLLHVGMALGLYMVLALLVYTIQLAVRVREEQSRVATAEGLRARAELQVLCAQLNPHFLFNTLHSVLALTRKDTGAAETSLQQFAELLRYTLRVNQNRHDVVLLREEWSFVQDYLALEKLRLGDRLTLESDLEDDALQCSVPAFLLQPLVENSIRHAIAPDETGGRLRISARLTGADTLVIDVADDGPGTTLDAVESASGVGLRIVRERLASYYGDRGRLDITTQPGAGFVASLRLFADVPTFEPTERLLP